jgi:hypothetical protein
VLAAPYFFVATSSTCLSIHHSLASFKYLYIISFYQ